MQQISYLLEDTQLTNDHDLVSIYIQGTDFISDTDAVRQQARNVLPADFTNDDITSFQYQAYSLIQTITKKNDWAPINVEFGALQRIEVDLAVAYIRKHFGKGEVYELGRAAEETCIKQLNDIADTLVTETGEAELSIARTASKSWNLNPDVEVPRGQLVIT